MSEDEKDKIDKVDDQGSDDNQKNQSEDVNENPKSNDELQSGSESYISVDQSTPNKTNEDVQTPEAPKNEEKKQEEKKEHEVIHKKDGRLHIYVRQDKYKGELKSKNWVGRLYIDGKQKISSSGTQNLEDAIPILEKWFDDVHANKEKEASKTEETQDLSGQTSATSSSATSAPVAEAPPAPITPPVAETPKPVVSSVENENNQKPQINVIQLKRQRHPHP